MAKNGKKKAKINHSNKFQRNKTEASKRVHERKSSSSSNDLFSGFGKIDDRSDVCHLHIDSKMNDELKGDKKKTGITKPKGLMNLGNTCYANSVLQVLSQTQLLSERLNERLTKRKEWKAVSEAYSRKHWKEILECKANSCDVECEESDKPNILELVLPDANSLSLFIAEFLREMNANNQCNVLSPSNVINGTSAKYSQFKGREQQDSHEFLRCVLDAIRNDEIRRQRKAILEGLNIELKKDRNYDDDTKATVKSFGHASNFTLIDEIFGGYLLCSVKCEECDSTSQHFEPFFDLSLPVSEDKHKHKIQRKGKEKDDDNDEVNVSSLVNEEASHLSVKDRRVRRQQKKAAKRERKLQNKKKNESSNEVQSLNGDIENVQKDKIEIGNNGDGEGNNYTADSTVHCSDSKENTQSDCSKIEANVINSELQVNSNDCEPNEETEIGIETDTLLNGEDDADDEALSEEEKSVNVMTSEFESMDLNKGDQLCDVLKTNSVNGKERIRTVSVNLEEKEYREKVKWSLSTISPRTVEPGTTSILSCLASFTSPELLVGANKLICESCGEKFKSKTGVEKKVYSNASKHMTIAFPPPVLTLHLKRFEAEGYHSVNLRKITRMVHFPLIFDLSPFVSNIYEPIMRIIGSGRYFSRTINYRLFGIVEHSGSLRSGHYTAFVKVRAKNDNLKKFAKLVPFSVKVEEILEHLNSTSFSSQEVKNVTDDADNGRWFYISDTVVTPCSIDRVLHSQAYILFYERVESCNEPKILDSLNS